MVHQNAARFYGEIAYDDHFHGIADATLEDRMAEAISDKRILFLANHGVVVVGETIARAFDDLLLSRARLPGAGASYADRAPLNVMPEALAKATHDQFAKFTVNADLHLEEISNVFDEREPSYAS